MAGLDLTIFRVINSDLSNAVFDRLMPVITDPGPLLLFLAVGGIGLLVWGGRKGRVVVVTALLLFVVSYGVSELLKNWFQRPRPCQALEAARVLVSCNGSPFSFPSSHATNATAQAVLFAYSYRILAIPLFLVAAAVGYSRVYVGVHYPADVVGGVLVGLICAAMFIYLTRAVEKYLSSKVQSPTSKA